MRSCRRAIRRGIMLVNAEFITLRDALLGGFDVRVPRTRPQIQIETVLELIVSRIGSGFHRAPVSRVLPGVHAGFALGA